MRYSFLLGLIDSVTDPSRRDSLLFPEWD